MKLLTILALCSLLYTFCFNAQAQQGAVAVGINSTAFESDNLDSDRELGFQFGAQYYHFLASQFQFRTGGLFVKRSGTLQEGNYKTELELWSLDIPLTVQYQAHDKIALIAGFNAVIPLSDDCQGACDVDINSFAYGAQVGANINIYGPVSLDLIYEYGLSEIAEDIDYRTCSVHFVHNF